MNTSIPAKSDLTRRRIVNAAATAFRAQGVEKVGVREVMELAGLTRGGFYFHFADKEALQAEAIREAAQGNAAMHASWAEVAPPGKKLQAFIEGYLSEAHRDSPGFGCVVAALGGEIGRASTRQREAFSDGIEVVVEQVAAYFSNGTAAERVLKAAVLMSSLAGVLMMSRAMSDRDASSALLTAARQFHSQNVNNI